MEIYYLVFTKKLRQKERGLSGLNSTLQTDNLLTCKMPGGNWTIPPSPENYQRASDLKNSETNIITSPILVMNKTAIDEKIISYQR